MPRRRRRARKVLILVRRISANSASARRSRRHAAYRALGRAVAGIAGQQQEARRRIAALQRGDEVDVARREVGAQRRLDVDRSSGHSKRWPRLGSGL